MLSRRRSFELIGDLAVNLKTLSASSVIYYFVCFLFLICYHSSLVYVLQGCAQFRVEELEFEFECQEEYVEL